MKSSQTEEVDHGSKKHQLSGQCSQENGNSKGSGKDEDSDDELPATASGESSDSFSSEDDGGDEDEDDDDNDDDDDDDGDGDGDDSEDEIPAVIYNHPLVNDLLDRFMRAQLQIDSNANKSGNVKGAGKKLEFYALIG
ncbi:unnamed protein product [Litomosoides sigmodontis]|uniref:Uncharacterized protein n=1 Tax=Litomosoides sigmodontis TaxID=42156 RepID=A0A3P6TJL5_LITSI|nr:unnamed protein product [Litomosoides sigmodontis]